MPDPIERCRHCFQELDQRGLLCAQCRKHRLLPVPRAHAFDAASPASYLGVEATDAMAGFAFFQWIQLEWLFPDMIVPMPDAASIAIGRALALLFDIPLIRALRSDCTYREDRLEEEAVLLLFDVANRQERLEQAVFSLSEAFPKKIYLFTLFETGERSPL